LLVEKRDAQPLFIACDHGGVVLSAHLVEEEALMAFIGCPDAHGWLFDFQAALKTLRI
jgi:hypothetical protein